MTPTQREMYYNTKTSLYSYRTTKYSPTLDEKLHYKKKGQLRPLVTPIWLTTTVASSAVLT